MIPAFIICRDRYTCTVDLVNWFESCGIQDIYLIDNDSTYEPLLEYYEKTPHTVIKTEHNGGHLIPWVGGYVSKYAENKYYVVSDPDVMPIEECPLDMFDYFMSLLEKYPQIAKIGPGLKIDDLPDHYSLKQAVIDHESNFWRVESPEPEVYFAPIDTTLSLHKPGIGHQFHDCIRTGFPYLARHLPWYVDSNNLTEEERHYRSRLSPTVSNWNKG